MAGYAVELHNVVKRFPGPTGEEVTAVNNVTLQIRDGEVFSMLGPLGALDLKLRKEMQLELKKLQREVGITFIYVTHDQEEALTMSDRIAVMSQGVALQVGQANEIYERPNCRFVADFIGETNFLDGTVKGQNGRQALVELASGQMANAE